jgi:hypothetical protein
MQFEAVRDAIKSDMAVSQPEQHREIYYASAMTEQTEGSCEALDAIADAISAHDIARPTRKSSEQRHIENLRVGLPYRAYQSVRLKSGLRWIADALRG